MLVYICLYIMAALCAYLIWREELVRNVPTLIFSALLIAIAFLFRIRGLEHRTGDYNDFLVHWVQYFRTHGGVRALSDSIGNYNLPYLYVLCVFSYIDYPDLYLIKLFSIAHDVLLAWSVMKLVGEVTENKTARLVSFLAVLLLPTVIMNGSRWGQCDSVFTAYAVLSLYLAMNGKPVKSMIAIALSFAFKLQAIFLMPLFLVFWVKGDVKFKHFFVFPLTYLVVIIPAVVMGRPFIETLTLYISQAGTVGDGLNYNSPSIYALLLDSVPQEFVKVLGNLGIIGAFLYMTSILLWFYRERERVDKLSLLYGALLMVLGIPFFLPHMHDRYFFMADVLSLALAIVVPSTLPIALLCSGASLLSYHAYLKMRYFMPPSIGAICVAFALYMTVSRLYTYFNFRFDISRSAEYPQETPPLDSATF